MPDPLDDETGKRRLLRGDVFHVTKADGRAIFREPLQQTFRVWNGNARVRDVVFLRSEMQDELNAVLRAEIESREVFRCPETWRVPLDALGDACVSVENRTAQGKDLRLRRVIE